MRVVHLAALQWHFSSAHVHPHSIAVRSGSGFIGAVLTGMTSRLAYFAGLEAVAARVPASVDQHPALLPRIHHLSGL
jgi:hypothetical protein